MNLTGEREIGGAAVATYSLDRESPRVEAPDTMPHAHSEDDVWRSERLQRILNVSVAVVALILLAPVLLVIAVLVWLTSRGAILYTQTRVGLDRRNGRPAPPGCRRTVDYGGKPFKIYKFRTMHERPHDGSEMWASPDDDRITSVGRVLRKYRLDELPQLFNVIRGEMNIVGPRPEQPRIFADLREQVHRYAERQRVLPGITGWAQVNQSYDRCIDDVKAKVSLDLEYIERRGVQEDLRIMLRTLPVMLFKKGGW